jgi:hypothetical protein
MTLSSDEPGVSSRLLWLTRLAIVAGFFAVVAPTLAWLDFFHAEENVVIATALETRRTAHWLRPDACKAASGPSNRPLTVWIHRRVHPPGDRPAARAITTRASAKPRRRPWPSRSRWATVSAPGLMLVACSNWAAR